MSAAAPDEGDRAELDLAEAEELYGCLSAKERQLGALAVVRLKRGEPCSHQELAILKVMDDAGHL